MSSEKTANLQLNKWVPTDYVKMDEFNENFDIIDDEIGGFSKIITNTDTNIKLADLSYLFNKDGIVSVITGDSLSYNQYDYDTGITDAYNAMPGMPSWSFMVRDAIHRNDNFFQHGDEVLYRYLKTTTSITTSPTSNKNFAPFNNRYIDITITDPAEEITLTYKHYNRNTQNAVLYLLSNPNNTACGFDVYVDGSFATSVNLNGTGKLYQGYEMIAVKFTCGAGLLHDIALKNFCQTSSTPDVTGKMNFQLLGIGTKYSPVYLTGKGSTTSSWLLTNIQDRILQYNPDFVCIITGTNDLHTGISAIDYETNLRNILTQIRNNKNDTQILLLGKGSERNPDNETVTGSGFYSDVDSAPYVDACKRVAIDFNCYYVGLMDVFKNIPIADWRYDSVHLKKYGNTILARTILKTIMPNGVYPKELVDSMMVQYSNYRISVKSPPIKGFARIKWNSQTNKYDIIEQSDNMPIISVTKVNGYTVQLNLRNNTTGFLTLNSTCQYGSTSQLLLVRTASQLLNTITLYIYKANGSVVSDSDYTNNPGDFHFLISF